MPTRKSIALRNEVISKLKETFSDITPLRGRFKIYSTNKTRVYIGVTTDKKGSPGKYFLDINQDLYDQKMAEFIVYACGSKDRIYVFPVDDFINLIAGASVSNSNSKARLFTIYINSHKFEPAGHSDRKHDISKYYNNFSPVLFKDNQIIDNLGTIEQLSLDDDLLQADLSDLTLEERRRIQYHLRVERNPRAAKAAKQIHGYTCQVCSFNYEIVYGELGHNYIEAHHLTPLSELPLNQSIKLSAKDDFAVLCSNCHSMMHRERPIPSVAELREIVREMKMKDIQYA
jgi:hypothetical protein